MRDMADHEWPQGTAPQSDHDLDAAIEIQRQEFIMGAIFDRGLGEHPTRMNLPYLHVPFETMQELWPRPYYAWPTVPRTIPRPPNYGEAGPSNWQPPHTIQEHHPEQLDLWSPSLAAQHQLGSWANPRVMFPLSTNINEIKGKVFTLSNDVFVAMGKRLDRLRHVMALSPERWDDQDHVEYNQRRETTQSALRTICNVSVLDPVRVKQSALIVDTGHRSLLVLWRRARHSTVFTFSIANDASSGRRTCKTPTTSTSFTAYNRRP